jgi:hypothetical protein
VTGADEEEERAPTAPTASPPGPFDEEPTPPVLPRILKVAGALLGSTTVLTGLLFYFGRLHVTGFFRYLRVNFTVLELTPSDYLIRSADGLFVPITLAALGGLAVLSVDRFVLHRLGARRRERVLRVAVPGVASLGGLLVLLALVELMAGWIPVDDAPWTGGVALAGGMLLLAGAAHWSRAGRRASPGGPAALPVVAEAACAFLVVVIGLFWAVGSYAIEVGAGRARETVAGLANAPDAVLYSERSLRLAVEGITEVRCADPEAAYRFRYDGLKLVLQSGDQYLLISEDWSRRNGTAVVLPRPGLRLEFAPPGQRRSGMC